MTYLKAESILRANTRRWNKGSYKLENNTYLERETLSDGTTVYHIRLHSTRVVTIYPDDTKALRTGGWYTVTTWDRIRRYSGARVSQGCLSCAHCNTYTKLQTRKCPGERRWLQQPCLEGIDISTLSTCRRCGGTGWVTVGGNVQPQHEFSEGMRVDYDGEPICS